MVECVSAWTGHVVYQSNKRKYVRSRSSNYGFMVSNWTVIFYTHQTDSTIKTIQCVTSESTSAFAFALTHYPTHPFTFTHSLTYLPGHLFICLLTYASYPRIYSPINLPSHLFTRSLTFPPFHPLTHSLILTWTHTVDDVQSHSMHVRQHICAVLCGWIHEIW